MHDLRQPTPKPTGQGYLEARMDWKWLRGNTARILSPTGVPLVMNQGDIKLVYMVDPVILSKIQIGLGKSCFAISDIWRLANLSLPSSQALCGRSANRSQSVLVANATIKHQCHCLRAKQRSVCMLCSIGPRRIPGRRVDVSRRARNGSGMEQTRRR